jgi:tRNA-dihydrouridine synthase B
VVAHIGAIALAAPFVLAPMAGYTHAPFRLICRRLHSSLTFTEMVTAAGIVHGSRRTARYLETVPGERPLGVQLYGTDPDVMAEAAVTLESVNRFDLIDINCGCPVPKVVRKGAGSALMADPSLVHDIVAAIVEAVSLPVTIKTRLGIDRGHGDVVPVVTAAARAGASAVSVHARYACDRHSGPVDWDALAHLKRRFSIPVIGNGGIDGPQAALSMLERTGVDAVMIARGALGNPWLFDHCFHLWRGMPWDPPTGRQRVAVITEHLHGLRRQAAEEYVPGHSRLSAEQVACRRFRGHLSKYLAGTRGVRDCRQRLLQEESVRGVIECVREILM